MSRDIFYHFILGAVQGLTEFLPVSSSAHLVITQNLFGFKEPQLFLDVVLHLGTVTAVVIFLWKDILRIMAGALKGLVSLFRGENPVRSNPDFFLALCIVVATVPTGLAGVLFKHKFEAMFGSLLMVGVFLMVTGCILFTTKYFTAKRRRAMTVLDSLLIGVAQGIAICPGISRSGITISTGIFRRLDPVAAAKFSFLLSIPAILGAALVQAKDLGSVSAAGLSYIALGFISSAVFGYISLSILIGMVKNYRLHYFSYYCWAVGAVTVVSSMIAR